MEQIYSYNPGARMGFAINRLFVRILASLLSSATLGKLLTHVPVTKQCNMYQPVGSDALRLRK